MNIYVDSANENPLQNRIKVIIKFFMLLLMHLMDSMMLKESTLGLVPTYAKIFRKTLEVQNA